MMISVLILTNCIYVKSSHQLGLNTLSKVNGLVIQLVDRIQLMLKLIQIILMKDLEMIQMISGLTIHNTDFQ